MLEVSDPAVVRTRGREVAFEQVGRPRGVLPRDRRAGPSASHEPVHALIAHQPVNGVLGHARESAAHQPGRHLPAAVEDLGLLAPLRVPQGESLELVEEDSIGLGSCSSSAGLPRTIGPRRDLDALLAQDLTGQLDAVAIGLHPSDESDY